MNPFGLRLVLVTPWNVRSAIARVNLLITRELARRGVIVSIVRSETEPLVYDPYITAEFNILQREDFLRLRAGYDFDVVCYAIGDHFPFHGAALALLAKKSGIVLLHDAHLGNLAAGWEAENCRPAFRYSPRIRADELSAEVSTALETGFMVEWPMAMATAGVVHAKHYLDLAGRACPGPVFELSLPVPDINLAPAKTRQPNEPVIVVTVGHINRNKLPDEIICAIGSSEKLRSKYHYRCLGPIEDETLYRLTNLANTLRVSFMATGWLDDEDLHRELESADAIMCLRYPVLEGASMSAVIGMLSARPTVVCNAGFYAEIPDGIVVKISPCPETQCISAALETILDEPARMAAMSERARAFALTTFTSSQYVDGLLLLIRKALDVGFTVTEARQIGLETRAWGLNAQDPVFDRLAIISSELFS